MVTTRRRDRTLAALAVAAALMSAACSPQPQPSPSPTATQTPTQIPSPTPTPTVEPAWPLTGVAGDVKDRPAVAVKIENTHAARPQSGLEDADVVWETIVEFDVSRFIAIYHSHYPEEVGPIRSVRPVDMKVLAPLEGVFVYSGGQSGILRLVRDTHQIFALDENTGSSAMWRSRQRFAPHNLYGSVKGFAELAPEPHSSSPDPGLAFAIEGATPTAVAEGEKVSHISLNMSAAAQPTWTWSKDKEMWMRSEGSEPFMSATAGQIGTQNVVVIEAKQFDSGFNAQNNAPVPNYDLDGMGVAHVLSGGKMITGIWEKSALTSALTLYDKNGKEVLLEPGRTWVELLPKSQGSFSTK